MCEELKFFFCKHCGNIIEMVKNSGVGVVCCGEPMAEMVANTEEAAYEKHIPVVDISGNEVKVTVGSVLHPMLKEHHIAFIHLETNEGRYKKCLPVDGEPIAHFRLSDGEKVVAAYEYCNLHGLWIKEI
jgi:superoxide reductase